MDHTLPKSTVLMEAVVLVRVLTSVMLVFTFVEAKNVHLKLTYESIIML